MLQQILGEEQARSVHVEDVHPTLLPAKQPPDEGKRRLHSYLGCLFDQRVISRHVECWWWWKSFGIKCPKRRRFDEDESFEREALFSRIVWSKDFVSSGRQGLE